MSKLLESLQKLGRALMLPIAVLPVAGLLLRLGQPDLLDIPMVAAAGDAVFANLGLLFAAGIGIGLARQNHGAAGVAAIVGYLVTTEGAAALLSAPPAATLLNLPAGLGSALPDEAVALAVDAYKQRQLAKLSVPAGILSGILAGWLYNRYSDIKLPDYLAFFGGRRFVPIASGFAGLAGAALFGYGWPVLESGMDSMSRAVLDAGELGLFLYGTLNRVLIVTGLHHIANNIAWFLLGDYNGVTGDLRRFFAGDPEAGAFMSGFFPVMMFGLPAACLAMYRAARPERRRAVGGLLFSMALTSFLTGVTEPVEFTFIFLAPLLYALHAVLTGTSFVLLEVLDVRLGFGFSAGVFDYVLNFNIATRPLWLLPVGAVYFLLYYAVFRFFIVRFDLPTPGRDRATEVAGSEASPDEATAAMVKALGGAANLRSVDACTTRLRLVVHDRERVEVDALKALGAHGVVMPAKHAVQVVLGPVADQVAEHLRSFAALEPATREDAAGPGESAASAAPADHDALVAAFGGADNVRSVEALAGRIRIAVVDRSAVDDAAIPPDVRAVAWPSPTVAHLLRFPA